MEKREMRRGGRPLLRRACLFFCALVFLTLKPVSLSAAEAPAESELYARSAVLMDGESGRVLYSKNGDEALPMTSTTKIMTCILALEEGEPDQVCTVSAYAASMPEVRLGVQEGETYYLRDLLYAMMLESDNDVAVMVAENIAGSVEEFADRMNRRARELGCEDTYFITPNGLDASDEEGTHSASARDMATILSYCVHNEDFCEITGTADWSFTACSGARSFSCPNHNAFLSQMEGAFSGKTGYTGNAGYCYVGALRDGGRTFIVALLACGWPSHRDYKWSDTRTLMQYGLDTFDYVEYDTGEILLEQMAVSGGTEEYVSLRVEETAKRLLLAEEEEAHWEVTLHATLTAPVIPGLAVGYAALRLEDEILALTPVYTDGTVTRAGWSLRRFAG
ncbi:MAG: D-alanyl-D-alanine carboxypeptidase [Lachnospiraceae bacterium]|nr:D-alanyl-D-alanine carboxypeptidase [Lachnospiraceae bacterium]